MEDAPLRIALWLNATATCHRGACTWRMNSTDAAPAQHPYLAATLYYGNVGVALFLLQLATIRPVREAEAWRSLAVSALDNAAATTSRTIQAFGSNAGFYYGLAGIAFGLRAASDSLTTSVAEPFFRAATTLETQILTAVSPFAPNTSAPLWNNTDIAHGASGTGLYLLWLSKRAELTMEARKAALGGATRAGHWLLERAEPIGIRGGLRWARGPDTDGAHTHQYFPTFCCGTAGVAYFLSELSSQSALPAPQRAQFLDAARRGASHVLSLGVRLPPAAGLLLPHEEEGPGLRVYYLGWCGGPPGWARLLVSLYTATRDPAYLTTLEAAVYSVEALVTPSDLPMLTPTPPATPPWANLGQCCGASAASQFLLSLAETPDTSLPLGAAVKPRARTAGLRLAAAIAARGASAAPAGRGLAMPSPEEHTKPLDTRWQAGWMQGAAGIGSLLLHASAVASGSPGGRRVPWPDEPWNATARA